jgi:hypothetical protein
MLILLSDVVFFTQVYEEDNRLGRKEEERVDDFNLENEGLAAADQEPADIG